MKYRLGNWLRGFCEAEFDTQQEAWQWLSTRFLLSFPSQYGRHVQMYAYLPNAFGITEWQQCQEGMTWIGAMERDAVLKRVPDLR